MAEDNWWEDSPFATAAIAKETAAPPAKAKTYSEDRKAALAASSRAATERDMSRDYDAAERAVRDFDTGPYKEAWMSAITPEKNTSGFIDGLADKVGALGGLILSGPGILGADKKTMAARDHLNTLSADVALAGNQQLKGSASDRDMAILRMTGVRPENTLEENLRIIKKARYTSGLEQRRALVTANWIGRFGSLSATTPGGKTYEQAMQDVDRIYQNRVNGKKLPAPPPKTKPPGRVTIDINGNPIK
jgi:hypothetical protein